MRICLIEDDPELASWLGRTLAQRGFVVEWEEDGREADRRIASDGFDAIVLDLGLPSMTGQSVLKRLRERDDPTPTLVITARDDLSARVALLHGGADDFLAKPFAVEELEARLVALIRRSRGRARGIFQCGDLVYDQQAQRFTLSGASMALSPREHGVMRTLIQRVGEPVSKQDILDRLVSHEEDLHLEAIEVIVHRLRKKLAGSLVQIVTLRGLGYFLESLDDAAQ